MITGRMVTARAPRLSQKEDWVAMVTAPGSITEEGGRIELISALPASEGRWEIDIQIFIGTLDEDFQINGTIIAKEDKKVMDLNVEDVEEGKKEVEASLNFDIDSDEDSVSNIEEILAGTNPSDSSDCPHMKVWYKDADSDGYTDGATRIACASSSPYNLTSITALDCDDSNSSIYPGAPLNCNNNTDDDCSGVVERWAYMDTDGDRHAPNSSSSCVDTVSFPGMITVGFHLSTSDCNDTNSAIYPGAPLNCNNAQDNDCSGVVERWFYQDQDSDSWTTSVSQCANTMPSGFTSVSKPLDCNDTNSAINPDVPDNTCNSVDNNCNGYVDESTHPCFAPTLAISSWGLTYVALSWSYPEPSSNVENFVVEKSHNGVTFTTTKVLPRSATSYTDLTYLNTKYYYRIYAKNATGSGSPSSVTSAPFGVSSIFEKTIGGGLTDIASSIIPSSDGGFIVAGYTFGAGSYDIYIVKLDSSGNVLWTKTIGGGLTDIASSIIPSSDGGFVVAGYTQSFGAGSYDFYIVKLDSSGNVVWTKTIGESDLDIAHSIIQSSDGGFVVAGETASFGAGWYDIYIVKLDSSGNVVWTKTIGGSLTDIAHSIIQSSDGGFVVAGETRSFGAGGDIYIVKLDSSGNVSWTKTIGGSSYDYANSIIQSSDGGFVVAGGTYSFGAGGYDFYIVKTGPSFDTCWSQGITNYTVGSGGSANSPVTTAFSASPTVYPISPTVGSGGSVSNICVSPGAPGLPMCYLSGSCDDNSTIMLPSKPNTSNIPDHSPVSKGCSAGGGEIFIPLIIFFLIRRIGKHKEKRKI